jgi:hypothetical protein
MSHSRLSGRLCARRGVVAAWVALSLTVLLGVVALTLDGGVLLTERRYAQATADACALAAAQVRYANYPADQGQGRIGDPQGAALALAAAHGFTNDGTHSIVQVSIPPSSGRFRGQAGYAEVNVTANQARAFSKRFGTGTMPMRARAVARRVRCTNGGRVTPEPGAAAGTAAADRSGLLPDHDLAMARSSTSAPAAAAEGASESKHFSLTVFLNVNISLSYREVRQRPQMCQVLINRWISRVLSRIHMSFPRLNDVCFQSPASDADGCRKPPLILSDVLARHEFSPRDR